MVVVRETGSNNFQSVSPGTYQAVCSGVYDIGTQKNESQLYGTTYKSQIIVRFELNKTIPDGEYAGKRYTINKFYTASLHKKSGLRKDLESWRGRPFTSDELAGFDLDKLIGANCLIGVVHSQHGKANIASISPLMDGMNHIKPELDTKEVPTWVKKIADKAVKEIPEVTHSESVVDDQIGDVPF